MSTPTIWRAGDRALCIDARGTELLRHGRLYLVHLVHPTPNETYLVVAPAVDLVGGWDSRRFAKVTPACDKQLWPDPRFFDRLDGKTEDGF